MRRAASAAIQPDRVTIARRNVALPQGKIRKTMKSALAARENDQQEREPVDRCGPFREPARAGRVSGTPSLHPCRAEGRPTSIGHQASVSTRHWLRRRQNQHRDLVPNVIRSFLRSFAAGLGRTGRRRRHPVPIRHRSEGRIGCRRSCKRCPHQQGANNEQSDGDQGSDLSARIPAR